MSDVVVLYGGFSSEREVSLTSGRGVYEALLKNGHNVELYDVPNNLVELVNFIDKNRNKIFYNALHGTFGEDGQIQVILNNMGVLYTHAGFFTSTVAMNKVVTKRLCERAGIDVAKDEVCEVKDIEHTKIKFPYVVKPIDEGSSVGVFIVKTQADLESIYSHYKKDSKVMIEEYIEGSDITVAVLNGRAMAVTELFPVEGFYDYKAKYTGGATKHVVPANIDKQFYNLAMMNSELAYATLNCNSLARIDFRFNGERVVFLELNTHPGMTGLSLFPEQAKYLGISYEKLCDIILSMASKNH